MWCGVEKQNLIQTPLVLREFSMSLPATNTLLLKQSGARLYVTLNRPERRNAMNNQMNQELHELADCLLRSE